MQSKLNLTTSGAQVSSRYCLELELIGLPKRFNQGQGSHWTVRHREAKKWHTRVYSKMFLTKQGAPLEPLKKASLELVRYSSRSPDFDGLVQSFKPVIDALKKCGVIEDDNMSVIGRPDYRWEKACQREGRIKILVEEIEIESAKEKEI
jgi:Holliday junction resolvase RusA-like endonuclease